MQHFHSMHFKFGLQRNVSQVFAKPRIPGVLPMGNGCRTHSVSCLATSTRSHYETLGINASATELEIKSAFRALAKVLHPDINQAADAVPAFMAVNAAYEALGDSSKRSQYDSFLRRTQEEFVSYPDMEGSSSEAGAAMWRAIEEAERARQQAKQARRDAEEAREKAHKGATALRQRATQERKSAAAAAAAGSSSPAPPRTSGSSPSPGSTAWKTKSKTSTTATTAPIDDSTDPIQGSPAASDADNSSASSPAAAASAGDPSASSPLQSDTSEVIHDSSDGSDSSGEQDPPIVDSALHGDNNSSSSRENSSSKKEGVSVPLVGGNRSPFGSRGDSGVASSSIVRVAGPVKPGGQVSMAARGGRAAVKRGQAELRETMRDARKDARAARRHASETRSLAQMAEYEAESLKQAAIAQLRKERLQTQQTETQAAAQRRRGGP